MKIVEEKEVLSQLLVKYNSIRWVRQAILS